MKKSERINQELFYLNDKSYFNLKDLMNTFKISKSTALRDISELERLGVPLYVTNGRYGSYHIIHENILPPIHFNEKEIFAIFFSLQLLKSTTSSPFGHTYQQLKNKLIKTFPKEKQLLIKESMKVVNYTGSFPNKHIDQLEVLFENIVKKKTIVFDYNKMIRHILPVKLTLRNSYWYCVGLDIKEDIYKTFRCDKINDLSIDKETQITLSHDEIEDALLKQQETYRYLDFKIEISKNGVTHYQQTYYPNILLDNDNQRTFLVGKINPSEIDFFINYLLGYGLNILSIYPNEIKESYVHLISKLQNINDRT